MSAEQRRITLTKEDDGQWTAHDDDRGLTALGETRSDALESLDAVVEAVEGDGGRPPTDEELREVGIDPEDNRRRGEGEGELPEVLR
jgi:predicted RNase H-like HicB family nuclease